jgi:hypothetical protein
MAGFKKAKVLGILDLRRPCVLNAKAKINAI